MNSFRFVSFDALRGGRGRVLLFEFPANKFPLLIFQGCVRSVGREVFDRVRMFKLSEWWWVVSGAMEIFAFPPPKNTSDSEGLLIWKVGVDGWIYNMQVGYTWV